MQKFMQEPWRIARYQEQRAAARKRIIRKAIGIASGAAIAFFLVMATYYSVAHAEPAAVRFKNLEPYLFHRIDSPPFNAYSIATLGGNCGTRGAVPYQSTNGVTLCLAPSTSGYVLTTNGPGADPTFAPATGGGSYPPTIAPGVLGYAGSGTGAATLVTLINTLLFNSGQIGVNPNLALTTLTATSYVQANDFAATACTGDAYTSTGFTVDCSGEVSALNYLSNATVGNAFQSTGFYVDYQGNAIANNFATQAQVIAGTTNKILTASSVYTAEQTLSYASAQTLDFSTFLNGVLTLTGNIATETCSNIKAGQMGQLRLIQDATGSRTTTWCSAFHWANATAGTLSTAASAIDALEYVCTSTSYCVVSLLNNVQ